MHYRGEQDHDHDGNQRDIRASANRPGSGYRRAPFMLFLFFAILLGFAAILMAAVHFLPMVM